MEEYKEERNTHIYQMYQILEEAELKLNGSVGSEVSAQPTLDIQIDRESVQQSLLCLGSPLQASSG